MVACTGSKAHLKKLTAINGPLRDLRSGTIQVRSGALSASMAFAISSPNCGRAMMRSRARKRVLSLSL